MIKVPRLIFGDFILTFAFGKLPSVMIFMTMKGSDKYSMLNHITSV